MHGINFPCLKSMKWTYVLSRGCRRYNYYLSVVTDEVGQDQCRHRQCFFPFVCNVLELARRRQVLLVKGIIFSPRESGRDYLVRWIQLSELMICSFVKLPVRSSATAPKHTSNLKQGIRNSLIHQSSLSLI